MGVNHEEYTVGGEKHGIWQCPIEVGIAMKGGGYSYFIVIESWDRWRFRERSIDLEGKNEYLKSDA